MYFDMTIQDRVKSNFIRPFFRYYSHQWRAWGACFVQSAWRRYKRRKLAKELSLHESSGYYYTDETVYNEEDEETREYYYGSDEDSEGVSVDNTNNNQNLGATILASKFAANTRRGTNQKASSSSTVKKDGSSTSLKMPQLFKPDEPDFSIDKEDD